jgi:hypothetical protein
MTPEAAPTIPTVTGEPVPDLLLALAILAGGWVLTIVLSRVTRHVLARSGLDEKASPYLGTDRTGRVRPVSRWLSRLVFYTGLLFTFTAFFQAAHMEALAESFTAVTEQILLFLPQLAAAAVLVVVAWLAATAVHVAVERGGALADLDRRLPVAAETEAPGEEPASLSHSLALGASALVYLLFLPAILGALGLEALAAPLTDLFQQIAALVPGILAAAAVIVVGRLVARLIGLVVEGVGAAAGLDQWGQRAAMSDVRLSHLVGMAAYALTMVVAIVAALLTLGIPALTAPLQAAIQSLVAAIPLYAAGAVVMVAAWYVGRLLGGLTAYMLTGLGFDRLPAHIGLGSVPMPADHTPSRLAGLGVLGAVLFAAALQAARFTGSETAAALLGLVGHFLAQAAVAAMVLGIGLFLAGAVRDILVRALGPGRIALAEMARAAAIVFSVAIALNQLGIGQEIVNVAFAAIVAALAGAVALAFGLGGRDLASSVLQREAARYGASAADDTGRVAEAPRGDAP